MSTPYHTRFLLVTHLSNTSLPSNQLRPRLGALLEQQLIARCQLLFCNAEQTELGWVVRSSQPYPVLEAALSRLAHPDCLARYIDGLRLARFELFEEYQDRGLAARWQSGKHLLERLYLRLRTRGIRQG
ncbi:hypothetical protein [Pseudomonas chlororaphis]|uniref:Uncharacterized protein n=1 Tax=Pseudomonas chlororaphis TaxID=587753 RepID=A0A1Q8EQD8_9PSED|nr:hypothetical protein [Pseudomonas chlororaphis]OLF54012.1 hypothetical protein BTN82_13210 [Pseudomonas chlororaphis]